MNELDLMMGLMGGYGEEDRTRLLEICQHVIASKPADEVVERRGAPYMERWHLVRAASGLLGNLYIHRFVRDDDEDMHCHPWTSTSFVLRGCYIERTDDGPRSWAVGDVIRRNPDMRHAIVKVDPGTITLFATGPKTRDWGFYPKVNGVEVFMNREDYRTWREQQPARAA
ncbi:MAG TPA: hypothetical protein VFH89_14405 [Sphingomicrobium sp.]|nr:hypothetical protein [Sphingomicrobium sp.]